MELNIQKSLAIAVIGISSAMAASGSIAETPSYNLIELKYTQINLDSAKLNGYSLAGSAEIGDNWFVFGSFSDVEDDRIFFATVEAQQTRLGGGYYWNTSEQTNVFLSASYLDSEVTVRGRSADGSGFAISTGVRSNVSEKLELNASLSYADVEDTDGAELTVGSVYSFNDHFGVLLEAGIDDDSNASGALGFRIKF